MLKLEGYFWIMFSKNVSSLLVAFFMISVVFTGCIEEEVEENLSDEIKCEILSGEYESQETEDGVTQKYLGVPQKQDGVTQKYCGVPQKYWMPRDLSVTGGTTISSRKNK